MAQAKQNKRIWVAIECIRIGEVITLRGTMAESDFLAILEGEYKKPFVEIKRLHWTESIWNEEEGRNEIKFVAHGKDSHWKWHTGSYHLQTNSIFAIGILQDCSKHLTETFQVEEVSWAQ
ncbi:MAG: hypothetical protein HY819_19720 [Acidobacteria bacterium]|nr:hypothetical protein [Acidobacteriota bacterium]